MKPRLLNLAAGVSLLLALAILALWVRSHRRDEAIRRVHVTRAETYICGVYSSYSWFGLVITQVHENAPVDYLYWDSPKYSYEGPNPPGWFTFPPVHWFHEIRAAYEPRGVYIAYWLLLLPTLPLPLIAIVRHRRRRQRETNNLCPTCGYDLRATPDRCPECGAVPASSASRAAT